MLPAGIYFRSIATTCGGTSKCSMICLILSPLLFFTMLLYYCAGIMWVVFFLALSALSFIICYIYSLMEQSRRMSILSLVATTTNYNIEIDNGLDAREIAALPTFKYERERENNDGCSESGESESNRWAQCAICLGILQTGETVKRIPACKHFFHIECIDKWLRLHSTCPMCRSAVVSSTPLQPPV